MYANQVQVTERKAVRETMEMAQRTFKVFASSNSLQKITSFLKSARCALTSAHFDFLCLRSYFEVASVITVGGNSRPLYLRWWMKMLGYRSMQICAGSKMLMGACQRRGVRTQGSSNLRSKVGKGPLVWEQLLVPILIPTLCLSWFAFGSENSK